MTDADAIRYALFARVDGSPKPEVIYSSTHAIDGWRFSKFAVVGLTVFMARGPRHFLMRRLDGRDVLLPSDRLSMNPPPMFGLRQPHDWRAR